MSSRIVLREVLKVIVGADGEFLYFLYIFVGKEFLEIYFSQT